MGENPGRDTGRQPGSEAEAENLGGRPGQTRGTGQSEMEGGQSPGEDQTIKPGAVCFGRENPLNF